MHYTCEGEEPFSGHECAVLARLPALASRKSSKLKICEHDHCSRLNKLNFISKLLMST